MVSPLISFVLPVYNVGDLLRECLDSIFQQDFHDFEVILVNDGSTDHSGSICAYYSDRYPNVKLHTKINGGLADARNAGLPFCVGKYVWFVDSDDYLPPNVLNGISNYLKESPIILLFNFRETGVGDDRDIKKFDDEEEFLTGVEIVEKYNSYGIQAWTQIYNLDYIRKEKLVFTKGALYEDVIFNLPLYASVSKIKLVSDICYCYRKREGSIMNSNIKLKNITSLLNIFDIMFPIYEQESLPRNFLLDRFDYYLGLLLEFYQAAQLSPQDKRALFTVLKNKRYDIPTKSNETRFLGLVKRYGLRIFPRTVFRVYPIILRLVSLRSN